MSDQELTPRQIRRRLISRAWHGIFPIVLVPDYVMHPDDRTEWWRSCSIIGTAFAVGRGQLLVTAKHVIDEWERVIRPRQPDTTSLRIGFLRNELASEGTQIPEGADGAYPYLAQVYGVHKLDGDGLHNDVAILRIADPPEQTCIHPLRLSLEDPQQGDNLGIFGFPRGKELHDHLFEGTALPTSLSRGIVSAVLPFPWSTTQDRLIQTDAIIASGNSGGPAIDMETGKVVGLVSGSKVDRTFPLIVPATFFETDDPSREELDNAAAGLGTTVPISVEPSEQSIGFPLLVDRSSVRRCLQSMPAHWQQPTAIANMMDQIGIGLGFLYQDADFFS